MSVLSWGSGYFSWYRRFRDLLKTAKFWSLLSKGGGDGWGCFFRNFVQYTFRMSACTFELKRCTRTVIIGLTWQKATQPSWSASTRPWIPWIFCRYQGYWQEIPAVPGCFYTPAASTGQRSGQMTSNPGQRRRCFELPRWVKTDWRGVLPLNLRTKHGLSLNLNQGFLMASVLTAKSVCENCDGLVKFHVRFQKILTSHNSVYHLLYFDRPG